MWFIRYHMYAKYLNFFALKCWYVKSKEMVWWSHSCRQGMREATIIINKSVQSQAPRLSSSVGGKNRNLKREKPTTNTQKKRGKGKQKRAYSLIIFLRWAVTGHDGVNVFFVPNLNLPHEQLGNGGRGVIIVYECTLIHPTYKPIQL